MANKSGSIRQTSQTNQTDQSDLWPSNIEATPYVCPNCSGTDFGTAISTELYFNPMIGLIIKNLPETKKIFCLSCEYVIQTAGGQNDHNSGRC